MEGFLRSSSYIEEKGRAASSPLIFALAIEPLAAWIPQDPLISGIQWKDRWEDSISLYADDILVYMADQAQSLVRIRQVIRIFGKYSGYTIN